MIRRVHGDNKLNAFVLPPLPDTLPLVPLPLITDAIIRDRAFTHTSLYSVARITHDFETGNYPEIQDYEKLEYIGDTIIGICADLLVHEIHPNMRQGVATMMHAHLVCNETLAQLADKYGLTDQLKTSQSAQYATKMLVKTRGSLFESYVAGVFYDYLNGASATKEPQDMKPTPAEITPSSPAPVAPEPERKRKRTKLQPPSVFFTDSPPSSEHPSSDSSQDSTLGLDIMLGNLTTSMDQLDTPPSSVPPVKQSPSRRTYGQAIDYVYAWLKPLYIPIIEYTLQQLQVYQRQLQEEDDARFKTESIATEDQRATGATAALNVYCNVRLKLAPRYDTARARPGVWRTTCTVTTVNGQEVVGVGERPTKKAAKSIASYDACVKLKILKSSNTTVSVESAKATTLESALTNPKELKDQEKVVRGKEDSKEEEDEQEGEEDEQKGEESSSGAEKEQTDQAEEKADQASQ